MEGGGSEGEKGAPGWEENPGKGKGGQGRESALGKERGVRGQLQGKEWGIWRRKGAQKGWRGSQERRGHWGEGGCMGGGKEHPEKEGAPGQKGTSEEELDIWERKGAMAGGSEPPGKRRELPVGGEDTW